MKKLFFFLATLVAVVLAVAFFVPQLIPASTYKAEIEKQASAKLGRPVTFGDDISIRIIPTTAFKVTQLQIDNPAGFDSPYLARVERADIGVKLFPLFSREVEITRFVLTEPTINLEKKKNGAINWDFVGEEAAASDSAASDGDSIRDIRLGDVRIVNGAATYTDNAAGQSFAIKDIDVGVTLKSLDTPLSAQGTLLFQDAPAKLDLVMTTPGAFLRQAKTDMKFSLDLGETSMGGDLDVTPTDQSMALAGKVNFDAPDLPQLAALMGAPLPEAPGFDQFSVKGTLAGAPDDLRLTGAKITFDEIKAAGDLRLKMGGARPKATGTLTTDALDLRPYMPAPATTQAGFPAWSEEVMDFTSLRNIDADLNVSAKTVYMNNMQFGESRMDVVIDNGRMTADIPELAMYEGNGSGRLVVNARGRAPSFAGNFKMNKVDAEPFSADVLNTRNILGLGGFTFNFSANGASQAAIMRTLDGKGGFDVIDGALNGINLAKLARSAASFQQGIDPSAVTSAIAAVQGADEATDFSTFLTNFTMDNGIITAPTIDLVSPVMQMKGSGTINLPQQTLDLRLTPAASLNVDGSGGNGLAIPVRITGTFSKPNVGVDVAALLKGQAGERLRGVIDGAVGDQLKDSPASGLLDSVLDRAVGGSSDPAADNSATDQSTEGSVEDAVEDAAKSAIGSLFGRRKKAEEKTENDDDGGSDGNN
ncbi:MAG: AsmA family protein [Pseudomonadota bacterium]